MDRSAATQAAPKDSGIDNYPAALSEQVEPKDYNPSLIYRPLQPNRKEIRLLSLKPGVGNTQVECELAHAFLSSTAVPVEIPKYETISYCWGDPTVRETIVVNGFPMSAPASAVQALKAMRLPETTRTLWIDSVCINQSDYLERGHQVGIMFEIYSQTQRNLVFVGVDDETAEEVRVAVDIIINFIEKEKDANESYEAFSERPTARADEVIQKILPQLDSLSRFYSRPWFSRLWVLQEVILPNDSICTCLQNTIPFKHIVLAGIWLRFRHYYIPGMSREGIHTLRNISHFFLLEVNVGSSKQRKIKPDFSALIGASKHFEASDPKDHVYALLGLYRISSAVDEIPELLRPNYEKPFASILRDATRYCIQERNSLKILTHATDTFVPEHKAIGVPSWVPHWSFLGNMPVTLWSYFCANGAAPLDTRTLLPSTDMDVLVAVGMKIDTVLKTTHRGERHLLRKAIRLVREAGFLDETSPNWDIALSETLIAGSGTRFRSVATGLDSLAFKAWKEYISTHKTQPPELQNIDASQRELGSELWRAVCYQYALTSASDRRRFFITATGYIGLGPASMRIDDIVVVLYGCRHPLVLRQEGEYHKYIGTAYVHSIMFGEAVVKHKDEGGEDVEFHLR